MVQPMWDARMGRRGFLAVASSSAAAFTLAGCSGSNSGGGGTSGTGDVTFHARTGTQGDFYTDIAKTLNASSSNGKVHAQPTPASSTDAYLQKIATLIAGGNPGDAMWTASVYNFFQYAHAGIWSDLSPFIKRDNYDMSVFFKESQEGITIDGKVFGLPVDSHPGRAGLYYNKSIFEKANMPLPTPDWTYDDLLSVAKELTITTNGRTTQYGFLAGSQPYYDLVIPIRSYGGDWLNSDGTKANVRGDSLDGLRKFLSVFKLGVAPTSGAQADQGAGELFTLGRCAMWQSGYWGANTVKSGSKGKFEWGVVAMPKGPAGFKTMMEFDADVILTKSKSADTAWAYLKACSTKDAGIALGKVSVPGARQDVWSAPALNEVQGHAAWRDQILPGAGPLQVPANYRFLDLANVVMNVLGPVYAGSKTVDDVVDDLESGMNGVLSQRPVA